jgi:Domain of unknown function (DUF1844)
MSDTPKFTVVDRRKFRGDEETETAAPAAVETETKSAGGPRLVEPIQQATQQAKPEPAEPAIAVAEAPAPEAEAYDDPQLPPAPTSEELQFQKAAFDQAAERLDDLVRAQNPGAPPQQKIGFEHLVQQLYLSAMMQMGAGTPDGQRPRIDILGARQTIDLLRVLQAKSEGNLNAEETRMLDTVLFELYATFQELTRMISTQPPMPPAPGAQR